MRILAVLFLILMISGALYSAPLMLEAESGIINTERAEVIADSRYSGGKGVALQIQTPSYVEATRTTTPDIVLKITLPSPGLQCAARNSCVYRLIPAYRPRGS